MKKVAVFGLAGTGKSTLARQLADQLSLEYHDLDQVLFTDTGTLPMDKFRDRVAAITAADAWIVDGNYSKLADATWHRADTVIWLDYRLPFILWRQLRRGIRRRTGREPVPDGFDRRRASPKRRSLLLTTIRKYRRNRPRYARRLAEAAQLGVEVLRFRSPRQTRSRLIKQGIVATLSPPGLRGCPGGLTIDDPA